MYIVKRRKYILDVIVFDNLQLDDLSYMLKIYTYIKLLRSFSKRKLKMKDKQIPYMNFKRYKYVIAKKLFLRVLYYVSAAKQMSL